MTRFTTATLKLLCLVVLSWSCSATLPEETDTEEVSSKASEATTEINSFQESALIIHQVRNSKRTNELLITGRVIPANETQLFSEVQGTIVSTKKAFKPGINYSKGEIILNIDDAEFELNLEAQRSAFLNALTGMMPDLKADYPMNYDSWLAYVRDYDFGNNLAELPTPQSEEEKYFITSNQIYSLYFQIKSMENRLRKYRIRAPYSGMMTSTNVDIGGQVTPGQPIGQFSSRFNFELEAGIPLNVANKLQIGDTFTFSSNDIQGSWQGKVIRINNLIDPNTQNIPVYFKLVGKNIRAGMYLEGKIPTNAFDQVAVLPESALGRDESVLVLEQGTIKRKSIETIDVFQDSVIVKGLRDQDRVILNEFSKPMEGVRVGR
ncbi:MAG: HlyD family efflux transporter periplasmic adaptor subunit [Bacteroidota bacterium]